MIEKKIVAHLFFVFWLIKKIYIKSNEIFEIKMVYYLVNLYLQWFSEEAIIKHKNDGKGFQKQFS